MFKTEFFFNFLNSYSTRKLKARQILFAGNLKLERQIVHYGKDTIYFVFLDNQFI